MTEVNLLPPELRRRQRSRSVTRQVIAGAAGVILLLLVVFLFEGSKLTSAQGALTAQNATNADLKTQIGSLQRFADLQSELTQKQLLVTDLEQAQVSWSGVLHDLSMVTPSDVYITALNAQISVGTTGWDTVVGTTGLIGNIQISGVALDFPNVALWLDRMVNVNGWSNAWITTAGDASGGDSSQPTAPGVKFNGSVDLTQAAAHDGTAP